MSMSGIQNKSSTWRKTHEIIGIASGMHPHTFHCTICWTHQSTRFDGFIFWKIRFPRIVNGILVGATLAHSWVRFSSPVPKNPLATPSTTGTTAGASLGALVCIVLLPSDWSLLMGFVSAAFVGSLLVSIPLALLSDSSTIRTSDILLAGIGCTLAIGAISTGIQFTADMSETYRAVQWSLGTLSNVGYQSTYTLLIPCIVSTAGIISQSRGLIALTSGEEVAWNQGVDIYSIRRNTLLFAAIGVGTCVAQCGPIAFVGLVVPHIIRLTLGHSGKRVLLWSPSLAEPSWYCATVLLVLYCLGANCLLVSSQLPLVLRC